MKPGIYSAIELDIEDYHKHRDSISRTPMMLFMESPFKYWAHYLNPEAPEKKITPAMIFGSAYHTLILEPQLFSQRFAVRPEAVLLKDVGREAYDNYKAQCAKLETTNKLILTADMMDTMNKMREVLLKHPKASPLIYDGVYEQSYFWNDPHSGLLVKARPDILHANMYVDIKTIADASPENYQREMVKFGYHIQGAMVRDARHELEHIKDTAIINIAQEKEYPYTVAVYRIDEAAIDAGHMKYKQALLDMKACRESGKYPDYEFQEIGLPRWTL